MFLSLSLGWPGAYHDTRIMNVSGLRQKVESKEWLVGVPLRVAGVMVKPYLLADSGTLCMNGCLHHTPMIT